jgi:hypothetical protein
MRRTIVRRLCKLLPPCEFDYNVVNKQCGLSSKGLQWAQEHCEAFFLRVLGDPRVPGSAPWPAVSEMKPKQELKYFASECASWLTSSFGGAVWDGLLCMVCAVSYVAV